MRKNYIPSMLIAVLILSGCTGLPGLPLAATLTPQGTSAAEQTPTVQPTPRPTEVEQATPTPLPTIDPAPALKQKIMFWHPWVGQRAAVLNQMVLEYNLSNPQDINVEVKGWGSETELLANLALDSQQAPHLVAVSPEYLNPGLIESRDVSPYFEQPADQLGWTGWQEIPGNLLSAGRNDAQQQVGLPAHLDALVMVYNKTWATELGFEKSPTTWQDFEDFNCAAAKANNKKSDRKYHGTGGWIIDESPDAILTWMSQYGIPLPDTAAQADFTFQNPELERIFTRIRGLSGSGCAWNARNPNVDIYFRDRYAMFISLPVSRLEELQESLLAAKSADEWDVIPFPADANPSAWLPISEYYAILPSTDGQEMASWLFMRWLMAPEQELRLALSDGTLPSNRLSWDAMSQVTSLPQQQKNWMVQAGDPVVAPHQAAWIERKRVLQDGFTQAIQAATTQEQINNILQYMDSFFTEIEPSAP